MGAGERESGSKEEGEYAVEGREGEEGEGQEEGERGVRVKE